MLIKDWKDQFLDLGDKQSLLASLRESPFYRAFEDVGARAASRGPRVLFRVRDREGGRGGQGEMLGPRGSEFFSVCRGCVWQRGSTICTGHLATWAGDFYDAFGYLATWAGDFYDAFGYHDYISGDGMYGLVWPGGYHDYTSGDGMYGLVWPGGYYDYTSGDGMYGSIWPCGYHDYTSGDGWYGPVWPVFCLGALSCMAFTSRLICCFPLLISVCFERSTSRVCCC